MIDEKKFEKEVDDLMEKNNVPANDYFFYHEPKLFVSINRATKQLKEEYERMQNELKLTNQNEFQNHT